MLLIFWWGGYAVNGAADVASGEEIERVTGVDRNGAILRLDPLPLARLVVLDLEGGDGLTEQKRERSKVGMATSPKAELRVLLGRELGVLHVPKVVLALLLVAVDLLQVVLGKLECKRKQSVQRIKDFRMQRLQRNVSTKTS